MELFITIFLQVTGGLGMFLYGMESYVKVLSGNSRKQIKRDNS
ncbi:hypothetical protein [uncultured Ilyobacter sp.]|nr:hypothetical protein [uncultured Ilyobacter sp.]